MAPFCIVYAAYLERLFVLLKLSHLIHWKSGFMVWCHRPGRPKSGGRQPLISNAWLVASNHRSMRSTMVANFLRPLSSIRRENRDHWLNGGVQDAIHWTKVAFSFASRIGVLQHGERSQRVHLLRWRLPNGW